MTGFEPATTRPPDAYSNRTELHPELRAQKYALFCNEPSERLIFLRKKCISIENSPYILLFLPVFSVFLLFLLIPCGAWGESRKENCRICLVKLINKQVAHKKMCIFAPPSSHSTILVDFWGRYLFRKSVCLTLILGAS